MAKSGHFFPREAGFTNSSGRVQSVKGYTRMVPDPSERAEVKRTVGKGSMSDRDATYASKSRSGTVAARGIRGESKSNGGLIGGRSAYTQSSPKMIPGAAVRAIPVAPPTRIQPTPMHIQPVVPGGRRAFATGGYVTGNDASAKAKTIGDQGNAVVLRGNPPIFEMDKEYGGTGPLRAGYKKGGAVSPSKAKTIAKREVSAHVARPAPKGHKGFDKSPLFGKK